MPIPTTTREYRLPGGTGYDKLSIRESTVPPPKSSEVLVKIHAVSLQYRDLMVARGTYPFGFKQDLVPGSDAAGEVLAVGDQVANWAPGDRVCANFTLDHLYGDITAEMKQSALGAPIDGVLTEYRLFPASALVRIPEHLSYEEASTLPCAAVTAYNALMGPSPLKGGDTVLVQGTGGVSIFALQFAVATGATVIATSSSDEKLEIAKKLGAKHLINYKKVPNWEEEVLKITGGAGVDRIVEVGGPGTMLKSANCVAHGGAVNLIGFVAGDGDMSQVPMIVFGKAATLRGVLIGSRESFESMNKLIGATGLRPVVDKVFPFEETQAAYAHLESQKHVGKVVVKVAQK